MIKQIYVCECDICGAVEKAKAVTRRNETEYEMPDYWVHGSNKQICICPACSSKLSASVGYSVTAKDPIQVYNGSPVVLDNMHDTLLSESSQGISSERTDVKVTTDTADISINDIAVTDVKKSKDFIINCAYTLKKFCTAQSDCNKCILQGEYRCLLADYDIRDWDRKCVLDHLNTNTLRKEYDAAKALIHYCNNCSCTARTCIFSNQSNICICSRGLPENWNLKMLSEDNSNEFFDRLCEDSVTTEDPAPVYGCPVATSDDSHIVYFSDGSRGIIQEITDVKTAATPES